MNKFDQELAALNAATQVLLDCTEPSAAMWEEYTLMRNQLFDRWQADAGAANGRTDAAGLQSLLIFAQQQDAILLQKVKGQLADVCRQLAEVTENKRALDAYAQNAFSSPVMPRSSI